MYSNIDNIDTARPPPKENPDKGDSLINVSRAETLKHILREVSVSFTAVATVPNRQMHRWMCSLDRCHVAHAGSSYSWLFIGRHFLDELRFSLRFRQL